jgi:hypothetical protein
MPLGMALLLAGYAMLAGIIVWNQPEGQVRAFSQGALFVGAAWLLVTVLHVPVSDAQRRGADAEVWTSNALRKVARRQRWVVLDHILFTADIDHVLITDRGVYAIETKYSSARRRGPHLAIVLRGAADQAADGARRLRLYLQSHAQLKVDVIPVVVLWGPAARGLSRSRINDVLVLRGRDTAVWAEELVHNDGPEVPKAALSKALGEWMQRRDAAEKAKTKKALAGDRTF